MKLKIFWSLWTIDALVGIITLLFFFIGIADGSVSSFNIGIWLFILFVLAVILIGSLTLKKFEYIVSAIILLLILAFPAVLYGLVIFLTLITNTRWN